MPRALVAPRFSQSLAVRLPGQAVILRDDPVTGTGPLVVPQTTGRFTAQDLLIVGAPTGGTFTLTYGGQTTAPLVVSATAPMIQAALQALASIGVGGALVSGGPLPSLPVTVTFQTIAATALTGAASFMGGSQPVLLVANIPCQVSPVQRLINAGVAGGEPVAPVRWGIAFPLGTVAGAENQVRSGTALYTVIGPRSPHSYEAFTVVDAERLA